MIIEKVHNLKSKCDQSKEEGKDMMVDLSPLFKRNQAGMRRKNEELAVRSALRKAQHEGQHNNEDKISSSYKKLDLRKVQQEGQQKNEGKIANSDEKLHKCKTCSVA